MTINAPNTAAIPSVESTRPNHSGPVPVSTSVEVDDDLVVGVGGYRSPGVVVPSVASASSTVEAVVSSGDSTMLEVGVGSVSIENPI